ncbi:leucine-rich repeat-containing protein 34 isoform X2 [Mastacembelus armatus]|uniref:leucine-rich repeat-containing protein 34 isoform X2 n=1 Tax=Mastacembelus armatus TaxID=205130 RepID=UPI000E45879B|nr:leucine-rich repeat-containing protein 34 isoform X2 [Mastacembelus armatus]
MANENILEFYEAVCREHQIKINPHVLEVLKESTAPKKLVLKLSGNNRQVQRLNNDDIFVLSKCLQNNTRVTSLDVCYNNITDKGVGHLADLLQGENSSLCSLDLKFNDIQTDGAEALAKSLQCNSSLLSLRLSGNKIGNRGAMHLASMLQVNNTLQELELADCDLEEWAVHFSEMLAVNSRLVELHIGKMEMTDTGMERLSEGLRLNHSLRYLDLRCNRVTRDGVRHLAQVLKQNPTLEIIDLSSNRIEDEGAMYLSEAITWPGCGLRELSVNSNNIRTEGLLSLAQARKGATTLTNIYIWGNHLDEPVCQAFRELISSGRLLPEQTDVSVYEVDGQVFLAEVFQGLRRHYSSNSDLIDKCLDSSTAPNAETQQQI